MIQLNSTLIEFVQRSSFEILTFFISQIHASFINVFFDVFTSFVGELNSINKSIKWNEKHCKELRNLLLEQESDDENRIVDKEDENSDTDASVCVEEREENSDSEQIDFLVGEEDEEETATYLTAVQKKKM
ncbi:hypothetical protein JTB14_013093 [Gonioctena quinquepunctata]|nr:hypothetical protein JTB14_013093 [Gonioctena quinquepunctata]